MFIIYLNNVLFIGITEFLATSQNKAGDNEDLIKEKGMFITPPQ